MIKRIVFGALGAVCGVVALFLICGLWLAISVKGLDSAEAATWVQSVGVVLGVAVAVWIPYKQQTDAAKERRLENQELANKNYKLVSIGVSLVCEAFDDLNEIAAEGDPTVYGAGMIKRIQNHREFMCKHSFLDLTTDQIKAMGKILDGCSAAIAVMQPGNWGNDQMTRLHISSSARNLAEIMNSARLEFERVG